MFNFSAEDLLSAAGTSGDTSGEYTWNPSKVAYVTLNGGASTTVYSENEAPQTSYTVVATADNQ